MNEQRCENGCGYYDFIRFNDPFDAQIGACKRTGEKKALETKVFEKVKEEGCQYYFTLPYPHCKYECKFIKESKCNYREMHVPTIAVDFDKVLFTHESWQGHYHYGEPLPGAKEALTELQNMGFKIMIWTTRDQADIIAEACRKYDIPFDFINNNPNQPPEINPSKPVADYYIDDRAVYFRSWDQALSEIKSREVHDQYYPTGRDKK
jgi:hypothetical protein